MACHQTCRRRLPSAADACPNPPTSEGLLSCTAAAWLPRAHWFRLCSDLSLSCKSRRANLAAIPDSERARLGRLRAEEDASSCSRRGAHARRSSVARYADVENSDGDSEGEADSQEELSVLVAANTARDAARTEAPAALNTKTPPRRHRIIGCGARRCLGAEYRNTPGSRTLVSP